MYSLLRLALPTQNSTTHAIFARNMSATAAQVSARYLPPLYAYTPISLPYLLIRSTALICTTVMMMEAMRSARNDMEASPQFPREMSREPRKKKAIRAAMMAQPAAPMPIQYRTKRASMAMSRSFRSCWILLGQSISERSRCSFPSSSSFSSCWVILK